MNDVTRKPETARQRGDVIVVSVVVAVGERADGGGADAAVAEVGRQTVGRCLAGRGRRQSGAVVPRGRAAPASEQTERRRRPGTCQSADNRHVSDVKNTTI